MKTAVSRAANAADKGGANAHAQAARRQSERDREDRKLAFLMLTHDRLGDVSTLDIVREQWKSSGSEDVLRILFNQLESMQRKDEQEASKTPLEKLWGGRPRAGEWYMLSLKVGMTFCVKPGCEWEGNKAGTRVRVVQDPRIDSDGDLLLNYAVHAKKGGSLSINPDAMEALEYLAMTNAHDFRLCTPRSCPQCLAVSRRI